VRQLDIKVLDIVDARRNHEVFWRTPLLGLAVNKDLFYSCLAMGYQLLSLKVSMYMLARFMDCTSQILFG
jgi:hypothetical protein